MCWLLVTLQKLFLHMANLTKLGSRENRKNYNGNKVYNQLFFKHFIYLFLKRGDRKKGREISMCGCLSRGPHWGPDLQPRYVPCLGIEPETLWFEAHAQYTELCQPGTINYSEELCSSEQNRGMNNKERETWDQIFVCLF